MGHIVLALMRAMSLYAKELLETVLQVGTGGVGSVNAGAVRCNAVEVWNGSTLKPGIANDAGISANIFF